MMADKSWERQKSTELAPVRKAFQQFISELGEWFVDSYDHHPNWNSSARMIRLLYTWYAKHNKPWEQMTEEEHKEFLTQVTKINSLATIVSSTNDQCTTKYNQTRDYLNELGKALLGLEKYIDQTIEGKAVVTSERPQGKAIEIQRTEGNSFYVHSGVVQAITDDGSSQTKHDLAEYIQKWPPTEQNTVQGGGTPHLGGSQLRQLKQDIVAAELRGGGRNLDARRAFNAQLRAQRV